MPKLPETIKKIDLANCELPIFYKKNIQYKDKFVTNIDELRIEEAIANYLCKKEEENAQGEDLHSESENSYDSQEEYESDFIDDS